MPKETSINTISSLKSSLRVIAIAILGSLFLALMLFEVNTVIALSLILVLGAVLALFVWPDMATLIFLFIIYTNVVFTTCQTHGYNPSIAAAFWILLVIPFALYTIVQHREVVFDYPFLLILFYFGSVLISFFVAIDKDIAFMWIVAYFIEGVLLYFLLINVLRNYSMLKKAIGAILVAGVLLGSLSIYQDATGSFENQFGGLAQRTLRFELEKRHGSVLENDGFQKRDKFKRIHRSDGPMGDPNYYAQIMIVLLPLALFIFYSLKSRSWRTLSGIGLLIILSGVLLTYSRGAILTLGVLAIVSVFTRFIKIRYILISFLLILIVVAIASPSFFNRIGSIGAIQGVIGNDRAAKSDSVIQSRVTEMLAAIGVYLDHPIVGVGPGQFGPYYSLEYMSKYRIAQKQHSSERRAHSLYFEMAAETGTIGFVLFMSIAILMMVRLWRERCRWAGKQTEMANISLGFMLSILAYLGTSVFLSLAYQRYYWLLIALAGATIRISRLEAKKYRPEDPSDVEKSEWKSHRT